MKSKFIVGVLLATSLLAGCSTNSNQPSKEDAAYLAAVGVHFDTINRSVGVMRDCFKTFDFENSEWRKRLTESTNSIKTYSKNTSSLNPTRRLEIADKHYKTAMNEYQTMETIIEDGFSVMAYSSDIKASLPDARKKFDEAAIHMNKADNELGLFADAVKKEFPNLGN